MCCYRPTMPMCKVKLNHKQTPFSRSIPRLHDLLSWYFYFSYDFVCVFFPSSWQAKFLFSHTPHSLTHKNIVTFKHQVTPIITYFGSYFISVIIITIIRYYDFSLFCFVWYFLACITWYVATHTIFGCYDSLCDECIAYHIYERRYLVHLLIMFFFGICNEFFWQAKVLDTRLEFL